SARQWTHASAHARVTSQMTMNGAAANGPSLAAAAFPGDGTAAATRTGAWALSACVSVETGNGALPPRVYAAPRARCGGSARRGAAAAVGRVEQAARLEAAQQEVEVDGSRVGCPALERARRVVRALRRQEAAQAVECPDVA